jgi:hypothetical protein
MKCPSCGDAANQDHLGYIADRPGHTGFRCAACGCLHALPTEVANLERCLSDMKARLDALSGDRDGLIRQIAETEADLQATLERLEAARRPPS